MDYYDRIKELKEISSFDESESYETDIGGIYREPGKEGYIFITASGCSCWEGEYSEELFATLPELKASLLGDGDTRRYNPSLETAKRMIEEAEKEILCKS